MLNEASDIVDQTIKKKTTNDSSQTMMVTIMLKMRTVTLMLLVVRVVMAIFNHVLCICNRAQEASGPFFVGYPRGSLVHFPISITFSSFRRHSFVSDINIGAFVSDVIICRC